MANKKADQKPEQRQGGLGKGLAALIPVSYTHLTLPTKA